MSNHLVDVRQVEMMCWLCAATSQQIEVYDAMTFTLQFCLNVSRLGSRSFGLALCSSNNATDWNNNSVHRVELPGSNAVMKWFVASRPLCLTVNRAQNSFIY